MDWRYYVFVVLAHSAFALMYIQRLNLSIAIIPVTDTNAKNQTNITKDANALGEFKWNQAQQGIVLSAWFFGSIPPKIPAGLLVDRNGGEYICYPFFTLSIKTS